MYLAIVSREKMPANSCCRAPAACFPWRRGPGSRMSSPLLDMNEPPLKSTLVDMDHCRWHRRLSISEREDDRDARSRLSTASPGAHGGRRCGAARGRVEGDCRARATAATQPDPGTARSGGLRLPPDRAAPAQPAHGP